MIYENFRRIKLISNFLSLKSNISSKSNCHRNITPKGKFQIHQQIATWIFSKQIYSYITPLQTTNQALHSITHIQGERKEQEWTHRLLIRLTVAIWLLWSQPEQLAQIVIIDSELSQQENVRKFSVWNGIKMSKLSVEMYLFRMIKIPLKLHTRYLIKL